MMKRTLWYVCLGLLCCSAMALIVNAAGNANKGQAQVTPSTTVPLPTAEGLSQVTAIGAGTQVMGAGTHVMLRQEPKATDQAVKETAGHRAYGTTNKEVEIASTPEGAAAVAAYHRWLSRGTASIEEKELMERYIFAPQSHEIVPNPLDAQGGPDGFGYRYVDNTGGDTATYTWIELCGDGGATDGPTGDDASMLATIGWNFPFYGGSFGTVNVSTNGQLAFGVSDASFSNQCIPAFNPGAGQPRIFAFWDDLYAAASGGCNGNGTAPWIRWKDFGGAYFVVQWTSVNFCCGVNADVSLEAILYPDGRVKVQYGRGGVFNDAANPNSATIGIDAAGAGLEYRCNASGNTQITAGRAIWYYPGAPEAGRCCYDGGASCQDLFPADCNNLGGTWTGGLTCANDPCPQTPLNDNCQNATEVLSFPATFTSDNNLATMDCALIGWPAEVWYTFTIATECDLTISLCGTNPAFQTAGIILETACPCAGTWAWYSNYDFSSCGDGNISIFWNALQPGTYWYPLYTAPGSMGPYTINFACTPPPIGRCCYSGGCVDNSQPACQQLGGAWQDAFNCTDDPCPPPAPNDNCDAVTPVPCPLNETGDNTTCTIDCGLLGTGLPETWHAFTIDQSSAVTITECGLSGNWADFYWVVVTGCPCQSYILRDTYTFPDPNCPNGGIIFSFFALPAGTYYVPILQDAALGAIGPYSVSVVCTPLVPGRCCYNFNNNCADNSQPECNALGGQWTEGLTCASDPCPPPPPPPSCPEGSQFSQLPDAANCGGYTSEVIDAFGTVYNYMVAENYSVAAPISSIRFWGDRLTCCWSECAEDPVPFRIMFCPDDGFGNPDTLNPACSYNPTLSGTQAGMVCIIYNVYEYNFTLPTACNLTSGWLVIQGLGDQTCAYLWVSTPVGDNGAKQWQGAGWVALSTNMSLCMVGACEEPLNLTVLRQLGSGDGVNLRWTATQTIGEYWVWGTTLKNNTFPDDYTVLAALPAPGAPGPMTYAHTPLVPYMNYVVQHDCTPHGRCCYGPPEDPSCQSDVTEEVCDGLGGAFMAGLNCSDNPCPVLAHHDHCENAEVIPSFPYTDVDDNTNADAQPNCGGYREVWYTFTIDAPCDLAISYCGTSPAFGNAYIILETTCPCQGAWVFASNWENASCGDGNWSIYWTSLPAGTYWAPILTDFGSEGPYTVTFSCVTAEVGQCCYNGGCSCLEYTQAQCAQLGGTWAAGDCSAPCAPPANYCSATATICDEYLASVVLNDLSNVTGCTAGGYNDYTGMSATLTAGNSYTITAVNGPFIYAGDSVHVWVDWNDDFCFSGADEYFGTTTSDNYQTFTGTVTPPVGSSGTHRMRVRMSYYMTNPCGNETYGEAEDYTIIVP